MEGSFRTTRPVGHVWVVLAPAWVYACVPFSFVPALPEHEAPLRVEVYVDACLVREGRVREQSSAVPDALNLPAAPTVCPRYAGDTTFVVPLLRLRYPLGREEELDGYVEIHNRDEVHLEATSGLTVCSFTA